MVILVLRITIVNSIESTSKVGYIYVLLKVGSTAHCANYIGLGSSDFSTMWKCQIAYICYVIYCIIV